MRKMRGIAGQTHLNFQCRQEESVAESDLEALGFHTLFAWNTFDQIQANRPERTEILGGMAGSRSALTLEPHPDSNATSFQSSSESECRALLWIPHSPGC
jgi:hypothetical protein